MASFIPRLKAPDDNNKYWTHISKGGLNECILINEKSCIPNCVGYAWGRFYEIIGKRPNLSRNNAENWYGANDGYKRSQVPILGAVICWAKGKAGTSSDGAGHVAIVEAIEPNGDIITSNSGYRSTRFWTQKFTKASGYSMEGYTFQGFILPPEVSVASTVLTPANHICNYKVRVKITNLNIRTEPSNKSISKGYIPPNVYTIIAESDGPGASKWGKLKSGIGWISLDYVIKI